MAFPELWRPDNTEGHALQPRDDSEMSPVGPETVATVFGGSRRAETASDSSNRLASFSLGLSEPSVHRLATGDAQHVLSAL